MDRKKIAAATLGCKVNQYETEAVLEKFLQAAYELVSFDEEADVYLINTCTVTNMGDKKSRQVIRKCKKRNPDAIVAVMGCYAQTAPDDLKEMADIITGVKDRGQIVRMVEEYNKGEGVVCHVGNIMEEKKFEDISIQTFSERTRAYIKIQDGCSQFCSYCAIPYARGPVRSRNPEDIKREIEAVAQKGFKEVVLTGIHAASYGIDLENASILDIVKIAEDTDGVERIRLSSLEPLLITEPFVKQLKEYKKICGHFHLSLQSGCDKTLKRMNRKYTAHQYEKAVLLLREHFLDCAVTTDIITGFPGETEDDFQSSYDFICSIKLSQIHVFPFSPKKGTPASKFKNQVDKHTKNIRAQKMLLLNKELKDNFVKKFLSRELNVLFEQKTDDTIYEGHTENYIKVKVFSETDLQNRIIKVFLKEISEDCCLGIV